MTYISTQQLVHTTPIAKGAFSIASFDRTLALSETELLGLGLWVEHWRVRYSHCLQEAEQMFLRLSEPISSVFLYYGHDLRSQRTARALIFNEMFRRQSSFWAWTEDEWVDFIGYSYNDFKGSQAYRGENARNYLMGAAYLLGEVNITQRVIDYQQKLFAKHIFDNNKFQKSIDTVASEMKVMGFGPTLIRSDMPVLLSEALLLARSTDIKDITYNMLLELSKKFRPRTQLAKACLPLSYVLKKLNIIDQVLTQVKFASPNNMVGVNDTLTTDWLTWIDRWFNTSTIALVTRSSHRILLAKAGRWAAATHNCTCPTQWTHDTGVDYVATVCRLTAGEWTHPKSGMRKREPGKVLSAYSKVGHLNAIRAFFFDCHEWGWLPRAFNPARVLRTPTSIARATGPNPRVIDSAVWAKIMSAGLSLTDNDIPERSHASRHKSAERIYTNPYYPADMVKAIVMVWLFSGLRANEVRRLQVGCISWQKPDGTGLINSDDKDAICILSVPVNKTSGAFNKPVDRLIGESIEKWEQSRPEGALQCDKKTGQLVHFLFLWRGRQLGIKYINYTLIPLLCKKAGIPTSDSKGQITSHRARSTIATQLYNGKVPMTILELADWFGHSSVKSTKYYAKITSTKLAAAYTEADYFGRNMRLIDVLVDQDTILSGGAANGEPWRFYDLGHGFCTYTFFDQCPHRMACAKCNFYKPKDSSYSHMLEAKDNLLRMQQEIPLSEEERHAVEDGVSAFEQLTAHLQNIPTPQGPTPQELAPSVPMPPVRKSK